MLFTIAIPAYKDKFLYEAIESVLSQTYPDFELLILNDASPEDVALIARQFTDDRIVYIENSVNVGAEHVVSNWNKCLELARGDYFICMGDDDKLAPNFLRDLKSEIECYPQKNVFYSHTAIIDEKSLIIKGLPVRSKTQSVYEMICDRWNGGSMFVGNYCYNTSSLRSVGGFISLPFAWGSDALTAYRAALQNGIANTQQVGFYYRANLLSISNSSTNIEGKVRAIIAEKDWFLRLLNPPAASLADEQLRIELLKRLDSHLKIMCRREIIRDVTQMHTRFFFWLRHRHDYCLSIVDLLQIFFHSVL